MSKRDASRSGSGRLVKKSRTVLSLFVTTLIIQVATGSIAPILTLYVRELAGDVSNIAFISGMIASVPGVAALLSAPGSASLATELAGKDSYRRADYFRTAADSNVFCANAVAARAIAVSAWRGGWRAAASRSNSAGLQLYQPDSRAHIQLQPIFPRYRQRHRPSWAPQFPRAMASAPYSASRQAWCCSMLSIHGTAYDGADWQ